MQATISKIEANKVWAKVALMSNNQRALFGFKELELHPDSYNIVPSGLSIGRVVLKSGKSVIEGSPIDVIEDGAYFKIQQKKLI